uniref:Amidase domain-containing protein n=1 Tax=Ciona savignyi TaxID=51511 RepID=H2Z8W1_CIOSA
MFKLWTSSDIKCKILSLFKSKRLGQDLILHKGGDRSTTRLWALGRQAAAFANEYMNEWNNLKLDVLICPPYPLVACPKGSITHATSLASYTGLYNLLNFPAGVVPVTKVTQKDIDALNHFTGHYGDAWDKHNKEVTKGSIGMPVGVQCVAPTWKDELCLKLMRELE